MGAAVPAVQAKTSSSVEDGSFLQGVSQDASLRLARCCLYVGLGLTSILVLRVPAGLTLGDIFLAVGTLSVGLARCRPKRHLPMGIWFALILVVVGGCVASAISRSPLESLTAGAKLTYLMVLLPWTFVNAFLTQKHLVTAVACWVVGCAASSSGTLIQLVFGDVIPGAAVTNAFRFPGFTGHVSDLGGVAAVGAVVCIACLMVTVPMWLRIAAAISFSLCMVGLVLSGSVSGMLATALGLGILVARRAVTVWRAGILLLITAGVVAILGATLNRIGALSPMDRLLQVTGTRGSVNFDTAAIRAGLAERAWRDIQDNLLTGLGLAAVDNVLVARGDLSVHNFFLAVWRAGGLLTLLAVCIVLVCLGSIVLRRRRRSATHELLCASSVAALAFAQSAPSFYNRYLWVPIGMVLALHLLCRGSDSPSSGKTRVPTVVMWR